MRLRHTNNGTVKDILIGLSDGLTVPFALTAGLSGILNGNHLIIVSGMAEIAAGCISMGLGGFLAGESETEHYDAALKKEYEEIEKAPQLELEEVANELINLGVDSTLSKEVAIQISKNKTNWANFMMQVELKMEKPAHNRAYQSGIRIALSYLVGGAVPLVPYIIASNTRVGFYWSCIVTTIALSFLGYYKSKVSGQNVLAGTLKVVAIGVISAAMAFLLARAVS